MYRMLAALVIPYGNSKQEAMYPVYAVDANGQKLDAAQNRYTLRFAPGQLPPVNAFWSPLPHQFADAARFETRR
jgi:hypothetical protein